MIEFFAPLFESVLPFLRIINNTAWLWLPFALGYTSWYLWITYKRAEYVAKVFNWRLLEIRLPKEVFKTPLAMEHVLAHFHQTSKGQWYEQLTAGRVRMWFSLELVSIEGKVHFFVRTPTKFKNTIEAAFYSQYPGVEIHEVDDYTRMVDYSPENPEWDLWAIEFALAKPDPYPIKTYLDYGLDKSDLKDEFRVDPMGPTIELLGSLGKGEQIWIQIIIRAAEDRYRVPGTWFKKSDWKTQASILVKDIIGDRPFNQISKGEQETIAAIQHSVSKLGFDCGVRAMYLAQPDSFEGTRIAGIISSFKQYNTGSLNGFRFGWDTSFDFPWEDFGDVRLKMRKRKAFEMYKRRAYFHRPYKRRPFILNSEELATIYHLPGKVSDAPGFTRVDARKVEPPANLPI